MQLHLLLISRELKPYMRLSVDRYSPSLCRQERPSSFTEQLINHGSIRVLRKWRDGLTCVVTTSGVLMLNLDVCEALDSKRARFGMNDSESVNNVTGMAIATELC